MMPLHNTNIQRHGPFPMDVAVERILGQDRRAYRRMRSTPILPAFGIPPERGSWRHGRSRDKVSHK